MTTPKWDHLSIVDSVALAAPSVRLAVVEAWANFENGEMEAGHKVFPVLAIQAAHTHDFIRHWSDNPRKPSTVALALEDGWRHQLSMIEHDVVVFDDETNEIVDGSYLRETNNVEYQTVVADWPPTEDAARLAPIIATLTEKAKAAAERRATPET